MAVNGKAQQYNFDTYTNKNGLLNNEVHAITQDHNGIMYFGTPSGLSVYDGEDFTNYDFAKGFQQESVNCIRELPGNDIVFFTNTEAFYHLREHRLSVSGLGNTVINQLYAAPGGNWYAGSYKGLFLFNNGVLQKLPLYPADSMPLVTCVIPYNDSLLLVGRNYRSIDLFNIHTWQRIASTAEKLFVRNFYRDRMGNTWISCIDRGVLLLKAGSVTNPIIPLTAITDRDPQLQHTEFRSVTEDSAGTIWMGGIGKGMVAYHPASGILQRLTTGNGLASNTIFCLYCDREDNLWIGTNKGLQKLVHKNTFTYSAANGIAADIIYDILPLPGQRVLTCGIAGASYIQEQAGIITNWRPPPVDEFIFQFASVNSQHYALSDKQLFNIGFHNNNLYTARAFALPGRFRSMAVYEKSKLVIGGDSSIVLFENNRIHPLTTDHVDSITAMCLDQQGLLWTANLNNEINGYQLYNKAGIISAAHLYYYHDIAMAVNDEIHCITAGRHHCIFYGSYLSGIHVLERHNSQLLRLSTITRLNGLSDNNIICFLWNADSSLLAGTGNGIDKMVFTKQGAISSINNINRYYNFYGSVYSMRADSAGSLFAGTESGLFTMPSVNIDKAVDKNLPIVISSVRLLNHPDSIISISAPLREEYNGSPIVINFASPSYKNDNSIRYTYRLSGSNQQNWSLPSPTHQLTFSNLSPGEYHFFVKAVNINGGIANNEATMTIAIEPAFWQKTSFYICLAIIAGTIVYFAVSKNIRNIRREASLKTTIAAAEMMALRAQMNPHFIFNCMGIIDGLITNDRREEAKHFLQQFSRLTRLVLENSQYPLVALNKDIQALQLYTALEAFRYNHWFSTIFDIAPELLNGPYKIPPLLLQPYVENAIVHGLRHKADGSGLLTISIVQLNETLVVTIADNGIGRKRAALIKEENALAHQQLGLKVTNKRIELLKQLNPGKITITISDTTSEPACGTTVQLVLPVNFSS